jgi:lipid-A-disaccharide synthase
VPERAADILLVAGEASGDLHGARLSAALRRLAPDIRLAGMGGAGMRAAGVEILVDAGETAVVGLTELWEKRRTLRTALRTLRHVLRSARPRLLVCIDFPDFNLLLARSAHRLSIPVCYFISPQVWAWRPGRVRTIRRLVRKMLVLFPFEEALYRQAGVDATFVGHPLLDSLADVPPRGVCRERLSLPASATVLGLLPGSRAAELSRHLPLLLAAAGHVRAAIPDLTIVLGLHEGTARAAVESAVARSGVPVRIVQGRTPEAIRAADFLLAVSGTVTLEAAILGTPMLITYRLGALTYWLARLLIHVRWIGLPNIVAQRAVVPELIQSSATPAALAGAALQYLQAPERLAEMQEGLADVRRRLGTPGAAERAAREVLALLRTDPARGAR